MKHAAITNTKILLSVASYESLLNIMLHVSSGGAYEPSRLTGPHPPKCVSLCSVNWIHSHFEDVYARATKEANSLYIPICNQWYSPQIPSHVPANPSIVPKVNPIPIWTEPSRMSAHTVATVDWGASWTVYVLCSNPIVISGKQKWWFWAISEELRGNLLE